MGRTWSWAPWFRRGDPRADAEPLSYRVWKSVCQRVLPVRWNPDLFDRISSTDWDLLIILDACRYDVLADVADAVVEPAVSPATATKQFLVRAIDAGVFDGTVYVSGSPQTEKPECDVGEHCDDAELLSLSESCWSERLRTIHPECVYEAAESRVGEGRPVVAHVKQPHYPHVYDALGSLQPVPGGLHPATMRSGYGPDTDIQRILANGGVDLGTAMQSYRVCVKAAWRRAELLAQRLSGAGYRVAVTADHGEAFGEFGFVEHPVDVPIRALRTVPWVVFDPVPEADESATDDLESRLGALGYVDG